MKFHLRGLISLFAAALICAGFSLPAKADTNAYLYIAHAAGGRNISSTTNPEYPLDLSIGGICVAKAVPYGDVLGRSPDQREHFPSGSARQALCPRAEKLLSSRSKGRFKPEFPI